MGICSDALYHYLEADVIEAVGTLPNDYPDSTLKEKRCHILLDSFYKKFVKHKSKNADSACLEKFLLSNTRCKNWSLELQSTSDELLLNELKHCLYNFWYKDGYSLVHSFHDLLDYAKCGPGASVDVQGYDSYTKLFSSKLSVTSTKLYEMYRNYVDARPELSRAEQNRENSFGSCHLVSGSNLRFVPKKDDISRAICIEPSLNMYFQQGFKEILERRLRQYFGIDLSQQPDLNRELARIGSRDDSYVTIDLSSASDTVSINMLKEVLPEPFFNWLMEIRSPTVNIDGASTELHMISSMGNATTFPLETILFCGVVFACSRVMDKPIHKPVRHSLPGNFGVFGDDIIVEKSISRQVIRLLELLGFSVNEEKTFLQGPFRESCGYDAFYGHNVRGVYIKHLDTPQDLYIAINSLILWSAKSGIPLTRTVQYLRRKVQFLPVPPSENIECGIRLPLEFVTKVSYNANSSFCYRAWRATSKRLRIEDGIVYTPKGYKSRIYNPEGLLYSFLGGYVRNHSILVRSNSNKASYTMKRLVTPNWDYLEAHSDILSLCDWGRWKSAIYLNLFR